MQQLLLVFRLLHLEKIGESFNLLVDIADNHNC